MKTPKKYVRDNRSPTPKSEATSRVMSANKSKNTKPEILLRKTLWAAGIKGYRCNYKKAPGRPDIAFPKRKIAIFVNGCFWHRCPYCKLPLPKNNTEFWKKKFEANVNRDKMKVKSLEREGWKVFIIWECEITKKQQSLLKYLIRNEH
ncbi:MAG TPA: very short patch repair endonuclease [Bacteroidia bacterium]|nr:very short patch repair endonuclease [Bacteroidia bacterium]